MLTKKEKGWSIVSWYEKLKNEKRPAKIRIECYGSKDSCIEKALEAIEDCFKGFNSGELDPSSYKEAPMAKAIKNRLMLKSFRINVKITDLQIVPDCVKNGIYVEIESTLAVRIHKDLDVFRALHKRKLIKVGILIVPENRLGLEMMEYRRTLGDAKAIHSAEPTMEYVKNWLESSGLPCTRFILIGVDFPPEGKPNE